MPRNNRPLPDPGAAGLPARRAALALLEAVRRDKRMLSEATEGPDSPLASLTAADAARAQRLALTTLRHAGPCAAVLQPRLHRAPPLRVRLILELATTELCALGAARHGVVNDAVALARERRKTAHVAGLVNAVLRRVAEEDLARWSDLPPATLPGWLRKPLVAAYGAEAVTAMEHGLSAAPPLDLTPRDTSAAQLATRLGGTALPTGSVRLGEPGQVSALPGFDEGEWWVQDAAAAIPARVLAPAPGARVLDLCAAPGGKTVQLAAAGAQVTALDLSGPRLGRLRENLRRTKLEAEIVTADALHWEPELSFDAILLDAPCSATGTLRRHPDLLWAKSGAEVATLTTLQTALLARAAAWLAPGGRLVYCTCSLLPAEGEDRVAAALTGEAALPLRPVPLDPGAYGLPDAARSPHGLRLRPDFWADRGGMDGFYIARLERV